jgi:hypothetical protein
MDDWESNRLARELSGIDRQMNVGDVARLAGELSRVDRQLEAYAGLGLGEMNLHTLFSPDLPGQISRAWREPLLEAMERFWATEKAGALLTDWTAFLPTEAPPGMTQLVESIGTDLGSTLGLTAALGASDFTKTVRSIGAQLEGLTGGTPGDITNPPPFGLFDQLPNIGLMQHAFERFAKVRATTQALEEVDFDFVLHLLDEEFFDWLMEHVPEHGVAFVAEEVQRPTEDASFEDALGSHIEGSQILKPRWPVIQAAVAAHRAGQYVLAIPVLLAQLEGIVGDALIVNQLVYSMGNKLFLKNNNCEVKGLQGLIDYAKWKDDRYLDRFADTITSKIAKERNGILHGRVIDYATRERSARVLFLILTIAAEFVMVEEPFAEPDTHP